MAKAAKASKTKADKKSRRPAASLQKTPPRKAEASDSQSERLKIPNSFRLTRISVSSMASNWRIFGGILLVYVLLNAFFASGLGNFTAAIDRVENNIRNQTAESSLETAVGSLASLFGGSESGSALQTVLLVIGSLVIIWALRQLTAGKAITVKQAYYHSMGQFIPFWLIVFVIILQLLPLTLGTAALGVVLSSVFTNDGLITFLSSMVFAAAATWSLYMLCSSVFALYIVTLPNMQPRQALRSAKHLVRGRRWQLMRRLIYLPLFLIAVLLAVVLPLLLIMPWAGVIAFFLMGTVSLLFAHTYLYSLYRSLL